MKNTKPKQETNPNVKVAFDRGLNKIPDTLFCFISFLVANSVWLIYTLFQTQRSPMIFHKNLDSMGLNYQIYYKMIN